MTFLGQILSALIKLLSEQIKLQYYKLSYTMTNIKLHMTN